MDGVIAKITKAMQSTLKAIQATLMKPDIRKAGTEQIKKKAKTSIVEKLKRSKAEVNAREAGRKRDQNKQQNMEL